MKAKVYIVIKTDYETEFPLLRGLFFSEEAAWGYIGAAQSPELYEIEVHEEAENGHSMCISRLYCE